MSQERNVTLYCREGSSDKVYQLSLEASGDGFVVNYANGKRGATLKAGTKTTSPVDYAAAAKIYDKVLKEKTGKGYTEAESGMRYVGTDLAQRDSGLSPQLPTAIPQHQVPDYENDDAWVAQEKFDGENRMITVENDVVGGVNRKGLTCPVPEHWFAERMSPSGRTVLCGEDMGANFIAFDAVEIDGQCIRGRSFEERQRMLEAFFAAAGEPEWMNIAPVAVGTTAKRALLARMVAEHREGIVYKRADATFDAGRSTNAVKHKLQESSTFEVVGINAQRSVAIALYDHDGARVPMGNVTVPTNRDIPAVGTLVEVEYMYRYEDGALEQPKYKGIRTDVEAPTPIGQITRIKRKSEIA